MLIKTLPLYKPSRLWVEYSPDRSGIFPQARSDDRYLKNQIKIMFDSVVKDNRCPIDLDCVWAGNVESIRIEYRVPEY